MAKEFSIQKFKPSRRTKRSHTLSNTPRPPRKAPPKGANKVKKERKSPEPTVEEILELIYWEKKSIREVAQELGVSEKRVYKWLSEGRPKMRGKSPQHTAPPLSNSSVGPFNLTALSRTALACLVTWGLGGLLILVLRLDFTLMPLFLVLGIVPWIMWLEREYIHIWRHDNGDRDETGSKD